MLAVIALFLWILVISPCSWAEGEVPPPPIITRQEWGSVPGDLTEEMRHQPQRLTIHHSGIAWKAGDDPYQKIRALQKWGQREKKWPDLPYHYLIAPSGEIFEGRDWHYRPESNTRYQLRGILNVELWGNYDEQRLSQAQLAALVHLLAYLCQEHHLTPEEMQGHGDAAPGQTRCPGMDVKRYLSSGKLQAWTRQWLSGQPASPVADP